MPGYKLSVVDKEKISSKYLCTVCKEALRDPIQTKCGHFYCYSCLVQEPDGSIKCVEDNIVLQENEIFKDNFMRRETLDLTVNCPNDTEFCVWTGKIQEVEEHETICPFAPVPCPNPGCNVTVQRLNLDKHIQECGHAPERVNKSAKKKAKRRANAQTRNNMGHVVADSNGELIGSDGCVFGVIGCKVQSNLTSGQLSEHMKVCSDHHMQLLLSYVTKLEGMMSALVTGIHVQPGGQQENEIFRLMQARTEEVIQMTKKNETEISRHKERLLSLEQNRAGLGSSYVSDAHAQNVMEISRRVTTTECTTADHGLLIGEMTGVVDQLQKKISDMERKHNTDQEVIRRLEARLQAQENAACMRNLNVANLEDVVNEQLCTSHDGVLLWRITDVARKLDEAKNGSQQSIYSPPFYSSTHGYKCCARIYLNGDGMGRGTHISLFFVLMRGEYDPLLRWPFGQKVALMLLDQDNANHVRDSFRADPNSSSFQRPKREMNVASGCPLFCPLSDLNKHAYIRDNTMFIKVIVEKSDMQGEYGQF